MTEIPLAGIVKKDTKEKKTGSWRTKKPIVSEACIGCGICVDFCPELCIFIEDKNGEKKAKIDYDYCKGCMLCAAQCPKKAIKVEE